LFTTRQLPLRSQKVHTGWKQNRGLVNLTYSNFKLV
jgi:intraflagellar transport protein 140